MSADPEGASPTHVDSHPFTASPSRPWGLCVICRLSEPAHRRTGTPYRPTPPPLSVYIATNGETFSVAECVIFEAASIDNARHYVASLGGERRKLYATTLVPT